jgi:hypothetical protein
VPGHKKTLLEDDAVRSDFARGPEFWGKRAF